MYEKKWLYDHVYIHTDIGSRIQSKITSKFYKEHTNIKTLIGYRKQSGEKKPLAIISISLKSSTL